MPNESSPRPTGTPAPRRTIVVTGATGFLGAALTDRLAARGHRVIRLVRGRAAGAGEIAWDPGAGRLDRHALEGVDAVVHLAGANIAASRWTDARKRSILESRVTGTRLLAETVASLAAKPEAFLCASAVGYYGSRGDERLDESASAGTGFLAEVTRAWERATQPAEAAGIRTVRLRFGVLLAAHGGALAKMRRPFSLGLGGPIGGGRQGVSWMELGDAVRAIRFLIRTPAVHGAVNVVAPDPVPQREFARALGRALRRPAIAPLPAFVVRALFGEMGEEVLLGGQFAVPAALYGAGFRWNAPRLDDALAAAFSGPRRASTPGARP